MNLQIKNILNSNNNNIFKQTLNWTLEHVYTSYRDSKFCLMKFLLFYFLMDHNLFYHTEFIF